MKEGLCIICNKYKKVAKNRKDGKNVCQSCYSNYKRPKKQCFYCKKITRNIRYVDEKPTCQACYSRDRYKKHKEEIKARANKKQGVCFYCKILKRIHYYTRDFEPVCKACYDREIYIGECSICKRINRIAKKTKDNKFICINCDWKIRKKTKLINHNQLTNKKN